MQKNNITVFTDGASRGNPGRGGWASIISNGKFVTELGGGEKNTTNNRMELMGVIKALEQIKKKERKEEVVIHTDSKYVKDGATSWIYSWQKNNWQTKAKQPVLNKDLWIKLVKLLEKNKKIKWVLVSGHAGVPANERCDVIATSFADGKKMKLYSNLFKSYGIDLKTIEPIKTKRYSSTRPKAKAYSYVSIINEVVKTHSTWTECEKRVKGVSNAKFKKALSEADEASIIAKWKVSNR